MRKERDTLQTRHSDAMIHGQSVYIITLRPSHKWKINKGKELSTYRVLCSKTTHDLYKIYFMMWKELS